MTSSKVCEYSSIIGETNSSKQKSILVVGLGNIGKEYQNTRHNVGFTAVERLSEYYKFSWNTKAKFHAELAQGTIERHKLLLAKPLTYMNLSGKAVQAICSYYNIKPANIFVLHDDIDLETGRIKYKLAGGSGGHNGLKSLDQCVGNDYHRIRIGVGRPVANGDVSDYVLSAFSKEEYKIIVNAIEVITNNFRLLLSGEMEEFKKEHRLNMKQQLTCVYADDMDAQYSKIMQDGLDEVAKNKKGLDAVQSFSFSCFDNNKNFVAGIKGTLIYGCLYVDTLWVSKDFRGQNYGTLLMSKAENLARERNCNFMNLCTTDWQAKPFYEKLGFKLEFVRSGYDKDSELYYLKKDL